MKRILVLLAVVMLAFSCDSVTIDDTGKTEEPATDGKDTPSDNAGNPFDSNDIPSGYGDAVLSDKASFLTAEDTEILFDEVGEDVIVMSSSVSAASVPEPGRIMVCPITERTPHGLLVRVVSVEESSDGYVLKTAPVALNEAFEELHVSTYVNLNEYVESAVDGAGNVIPAEYVSADIWQEFAKSPEDTTFSIPTKAAGAGSANLSMRFPLENDWFKGYLFSDITLNVAIDITSHSIQRFDISIVLQAGVYGDLVLSSTEAEFKCKLAELKYRLRPFLIPGTPIVLVPTLYAEETLAAKGEINLKTAMRYQFVNMMFSFSYDGGSPSFVPENLSEDSDSYLKFTSLDMSAELDLKMVCGGRFGIYNDNLLSLGVEASAGSLMSVSNEITMDDTGLLSSNPAVEVTPHLGVEAYYGSFLFGISPDDEDDHPSFSMEYELAPFDLTVLPEFDGVASRREGGKLTVSATVGNSSLLTVDEEGFALFADEDKEPLVHLSFSSADVKSDAAAGDAGGIRSLTFDLPSSDRSYTAKPYVVADGKHYYGGSGKKRLIKIIRDYSGWQETTIYTYDSYGRVVKEVTSFPDGETSCSTYEYHDGYVRADVGIDRERTISEKGVDFVFDDYFHDLSWGSDSEGNLLSYEYYDAMNYVHYGCWIYESGNIVTYNSGHSAIISGNQDSSYTLNASYTNMENKLNLDVISCDMLDIPYDYMILKMKPLTSHLLNHTDFDLFSSYILDEDGYVLTASETNVDWGHLTYTFEYEEF